MFIHLQVDEPGGYDPEAFNGVWPEGGVSVIKLHVPPNMKTWRTESNWHNIVILLAYGENPNNHLYLDHSSSALFLLTVTVPLGIEQVSGVVMFR